MENTAQALGSASPMPVPMVKALSLFLLAPNGLLTTCHTCAQTEEPLGSDHWVPLLADASPGSGAVSSHSQVSASH